MNMTTAAAMAVMVLAICAAPLHADGTSLRCGNSLVSAGDTMYKVRRQCGEPLYERRIGERRFYRILKHERLKIEEIVQLVEWVYERDQGEYVLTFEGSRLVNKEYLK